MFSVLFLFSFIVPLSSLHEISFSMGKTWGSRNLTVQQLNGITRGRQQDRTLDQLAAQFPNPLYLVPFTVFESAAAPSSKSSPGDFVLLTVSSTSLYSVLPAMILAVLPLPYRATYQVSCAPLPPFRPSSVVYSRLDSTDDVPLRSRSSTRKIRRGELRGRKRMWDKHVLTVVSGALVG